MPGFYDDAMYVLEETLASGSVATHVMRSRYYYAIGAPTLARLMAEAGFDDVTTLADAFYQPVLVGTKT